MMPLKKKPESSSNTEVVDRTSKALSTDEILSLLSKNKNDFVRESEISSNISNAFNKVTPYTLAEKRKINKEDDSSLSKKLDKSQEKINDDNIEQVVEEKKPVPEKKYTEEEAKKLANEFAKKYYNNGYNLGVKKTTEELQKGDMALAVTLKRTTDNLFAITPDFVKKLNQSINSLISQLCKEVLGYEIENNTKFFEEKIKNLVDSIEGSIKNLEVFLSSKDHSALIDYNKKNNIQLSFKISSDDKLDRGDIKIKSGSIEINDIVSNKIKFSASNNLDSDFEKLKLDSIEHKNQNT